MASKTYSDDPELYMYTSLTAGSSHIVTATSRMETILKANRIPFKAIDLATDEKARMLWGRRAGKDESGRARKLPGLVQMGLIVGDLVEVEDWNEYGELKQHVKIVGNSNMTPVRTPAGTPSNTPAKTAAAQKENTKPQTTTASTSKVTEPTKSSIPEPTPITLALRQVGQEAAQKAKDNKKKPMTTFIGVAKAETPKEKKAPEPVKTEDESRKDTIDPITSVQSPGSTAWKTLPASMSIPLPPPSLAKLESLQSPTSTSWKLADTDPPIMSYRGSTISVASEEEIKKIEDEEAIPEVSDEEEEDDEDEDT